MRFLVGGATLASVSKRRKGEYLSIALVPFFAPVKFLQLNSIWLIDLG